MENFVFCYRYIVQMTLFRFQDKSKSPAGDIKANMWKSWAARWVSAGKTTVCQLSSVRSCSSGKSGLDGWLAARCTWSRGLRLQVRTCSLRYFPPLHCRVWRLGWTVTMVNQQYSTSLTPVKGNHDKVIPFYLTSFRQSLMHLIALKVKMVNRIWVKMQQNTCSDFFIRLGLDFIQNLLGLNKGGP